MNAIEWTKSGCIKIPNKLFEDNRGYFCELYRESKFSFLPAFVQDNLSRSYTGVVRGMHFQTRNPQGKLVRVLSGIVTDVVVDLRDGSPTYGTVESFLLLPDDYSVYVPPGFAHGFWVHKEAMFHYKCTTEYDPGSDGGINPSDYSKIYPWYGQNVVIAEKDRRLPLFQDFKSPFKMDQK